jgi:5-formyltetrahydrofolate cyclo-ligase
MLARRRALPIMEVKSASILVQQKFIVTAEFADARVIALYAPIHNEVDTTEVMHAALASAKIVLFPAVCHRGLEFRRITNPSVLHRGAFDILEPDATCLAHFPEEVDLIVVPGVAFDVFGRRIGYGKGYYDKSLHHLSGKGKIVGFCYDFQLVYEISDEPHDVKMDTIITERRTINLRY